MKDFTHIAKELQEDKKVVFAAQSCRSFHQRMLICRYVFEKGAVPINPFTVYGYYLYELVDRDLIRNANNNLLKRCDELWVFGEVSDGVLAEIQMFKRLGRPIRYFDISELPDVINEIEKKEVIMEDDVREYKEEL